jgi:hypothetical protein
MNQLSFSVRENPIDAQSLANLSRNAVVGLLLSALLFFIADL